MGETQEKQNTSCNGVSDLMGTQGVTVMFSLAELS